MREVKGGMGRRRAATGYWLVDLCEMAVASPDKNREERDFNLIQVAFVRSWPPPDDLSEKHESKIGCHVSKVFHFNPLCGRHLSSCSMLKKTGLKMRNKMCKSCIHPCNGIRHLLSYFSLKSSRCHCRDDDVDSMFSSVISKWTALRDGRTNLPLPPSSLLLA